MSASLKTLLALGLIASLSACVAGGNDTVNTEAELESTLDQDIDGDGQILQGGVEVGASG